jgi:hypothetical protein
MGRNLAWRWRLLSRNEIHQLVLLTGSDQIEPVSGGMEFGSNFVLYQRVLCRITN